METSIDEIKSTICEFIVWAWKNGEYILTNVSSSGADRLSEAELLQLATRFAHERAKSMEM